MKTYRERTEAIQAKVKAKKRRRTQTWVAVIASACAFLLIFNLTLFVPYTTRGADPEQYRDSAYYPLIRSIADIKYPERTTTNFKEWMPSFSAAKDEGTAGSDMAPGSSTPDEDAYREVTDNQVAGVTEGDLFKRSDRYLFYLAAKTYTDASVSSLASELVLRAYTIDGEESKECGELTVAPEEGVSFKGYEAEREMYLAEDLSAVTILTPCYLSGEGAATAIITVETEDAGTMSVKDVQYLSGSYISSRALDGKLLVVNSFSVRSRPDFSDAKTFLPFYGRCGEMQFFAADQIEVPACVTRTDYTLLLSLDAESGAVCDAEALFSYTSEVYVAPHDLYVTNTYRKTQPSAPTEGDVVPAEPRSSIFTDITRIAYAGGMFGESVSATCEGMTIDRYCMDAYEGVFRIFLNEGDGNNASLYLFEAESMRLLGKKRRFAPEGETVQSARFDGNTGYACTAEIVAYLDPVYVFDLSDPARISSKDTGTVAGYSIALKKFYGDTLLGIGFGGAEEWAGKLKVEAYAETGDAVRSVDKYTRNADFSSVYKAYFLDSETGLVGLGIIDGTYPRQPQYLLLRFDGYKFSELAVRKIGDIDEVRAFCADGYFYIVDPQGLQVFSLV